MTPDLDQLARRFDADGVSAIALMGSYARGDAGPHSDVDLVRFLSPGAEQVGGDGSHLIDGRLVVVSDVLAEETEAWFTAPEQAVSHIPGVLHAKPLLDRDGSFAALQARAHAFVWDPSMQQAADRWASRQMVGWIEEVHKGLEGLRRDDVGRLLNALFGLSWGISRVVQVQRGVFLDGDNAFFSAVEAAIGADTRWARLRRIAFGVEGGLDGRATLRERVEAGLHLYVDSAGLLQDILQPADAPMVQQTVARIRSALERAEQ